MPDADMKRAEYEAGLREKYPILAYFEVSHLPPHLAVVSAPCRRLAYDMASVPRNAETSAGLRKLLEAKDCFVRAMLQGGDR